MMGGARVAVLGEALIDLLPGAAADLVARPGGSPANVAVGLARLGVATVFLGRTSTDQWGDMIRTHLRDNGVEVAGPTGPEPTAIALVDVTDDGEPGYRFLWEGTADRLLDVTDLPDDLDRVQVVHVGSLGATLPPGDAAVRSLVERERDDRIVTFDPNVRPDLITDVDAVRSSLLDLARAAHVVKASVDDLAWLVPGTPADDVAHDLAARDVSLVAITAGPHAVRLVGQRAEIEIAPQDGPVVDTVGAGDAFMAGLIAGLLEAGLDTPQRLHTAGPDALRAAGDLAVQAAAATVARVGADPPTRGEVGQAP